MAQPPFFNLNPNQGQPARVPAGPPPQQQPPAQQQQQQQPRMPPRNILPHDIRPGRAVEITDVSQDMLSEADMRGRLMEYAAYRFEKVPQQDLYDEYGDLQLPTWDRVIRNQVRDMSHSQMAREIRHLDRTTLPVVEKKRELNPAQQRQIDRAQELLMANEGHSELMHYQWVLAQINHQLREITPPLVARGKVYPCTRTWKSNSGRKRGPCATVQSSHHHGPGRHHHKKRRYERISFTAYFRREPRPNADIAALWEAKRAQNNQRAWAYAHMQRQPMAQQQQQQQQPQQQQPLNRPPPPRPQPNPPNRPPNPPNKRSPQNRPSSPSDSESGTSDSWASSGSTSRSSAPSRGHSPRKHHDKKAAKRRNASAERRRAEHRRGERRYYGVPEVFPQHGPHLRAPLYGGRGMMPPPGPPGSPPRPPMALPHDERELREAYRMGRQDLAEQMLGARGSGGGGGRSSAEPQLRPRVVQAGRILDPDLLHPRGRRGSFDGLDDDLPHFETLSLSDSCDSEDWRARDYRRREFERRVENGSLMSDDPWQEPRRGGGGGHGGWHDVHHFIEVEERGPHRFGRRY